METTATPRTPSPRRRSTARLLAPLVALSAAAVPGAAGAQDERPAKPDQVFYLNDRGQLATATGRVTQNSLAGVLVETRKGERKLDAAQVERIVFGEAPPAFHDGEAYLERGDHEDAAASFRLAASDPLTRAVVQAAARLGAAESELALGATEPAAFGRARDEAERFLVDFPTNRSVPRVRFLQARATLLAGEPAAAAEDYRALFREISDGEPPEGYPRLLCFRAGVEAARASLEAGNVAQARELYRSLESELPRALAAVAEGTPERASLLALQAAARLGDGFCLLAEGSLGPAKTFFQGQLGEAGPDDAALRYGAHLGLAEVLLAEGEARAAQLEFAVVSALDHTDRDRVARALVGLAECALELPDENARSQAQRWVQAVQERYGDTPSVLRAQELAGRI